MGQAASVRLVGGGPFGIAGRDMGTLVNRLSFVDPKVCKGD